MCVLFPGPVFPNSSTNIVSYGATNCTVGGKRGCLFNLDLDPEERTDHGVRQVVH